MIKIVCFERKRNVLLSLTAGLFLSIDSVRGVKEVATNTFYVKIKPGSDGKQNPNDLAHQIARRNGFHNLGPVRHAQIFNTNVGISLLHSLIAIIELGVGTKSLISELT